MEPRKLNYWAVATVAFMLLPVAATAQAKRSPQYTRCMDKVDDSAMKNSQWAACASAELKKLDGVLNSEYNRVRKQLTSEQQDAMTKGQRSWLKFREDWCRFEEVGPMAPGGAASYNFCLMEVTDKHIDKLKEIEL